MLKNKFFNRCGVPVVVLTLLICVGVAWHARAYLGDLTLDGQVDMQDLAQIAQALGASESLGSPNWDPMADLDLNGKVDVADLAIAGRSYASPRQFHFPRQISNRASTFMEFEACLDGQDRIHIAWGDSNDIFYTRLDRYGNTLVDDVLLDTVNAEEVAIGCDESGNAHIVWLCGQNLCQARFNPWGYQIIEKEVLYARDIKDTHDSLAIDLDALGQAHLSFSESFRNVFRYAMTTVDGELTLLADVGSQVYTDTNAIYQDLAVDQEDDVHMMWYEVNGPDRIYYARYGFGDSDSLPGQILGYTGYDGLVTGVRRPDLAVDPSGNAYVLWTMPGSIYLDKVAPDGTVLLDDVPIFPEYYASSSGLATSQIATDLLGYVHLLSYARFNGGAEHTTYGVFDAQANILEPQRWVIYGNPVREPILMVDSQQDAQLVYRSLYKIGYPACPDNTLCYLGTAFEPSAYDRLLPDLGMDVAHLSWSPVVARWGQTLVVTATVFNGGWMTSLPVSVTLDLQLSPGMLLGGADHVALHLPPLDAYQNVVLTATLPLPATPPSGFESLEYVRLLGKVDATEVLSETTETNNSVDVPLLIEPLPTTAGLFLVVKDQTQTARGGDPVLVAEPLNTGSATLEGPGLSRTVPISYYVNILARDLPLTNEMTAYSVTWQAAGYRPAGPASASLGRNPLDPYLVDYDPNNTILLYTDRWATLSGALTQSGTGDALAGAVIRLVGRDLRFETVTDANGQFSLLTDARLGKLIPGDYTLRVSAAYYAPQTASLTLVALEDRTWNQAFEPTTLAYLHGRVLNLFGRPVSGAQVTVQGDAACAAAGLSATSSADGTFDLLEIPATCTSLQVTRSGYAAYSETLALTPGLESYTEITLIFDPPAEVVSGQRGFASWYQDEGSEDLLPDPPDDANFFLKQAFSVFSSKFWPSYRVQVLWGGYDAYLDAVYSGPTDNRRLGEVQVRLDPREFEIHKVSGKGEIKLSGQSIGLQIGVMGGGEPQTALWVIEARLVDADSGAVIKTVDCDANCQVLGDTGLVFDFQDALVSDWANAEVWVYLKVGKNEGEWKSSPILRGWHLDQQVLRFKLSNGDLSGDYVLVNFPIP